MRYFLQDQDKPGTRPKGGESKRSADKSRDYAEAYYKYAAQVIPQIDAEIVKPGTRPKGGESKPIGEDKNSHLWMETR